ASKCSGCSSGFPCSDASWLARCTASCAFIVNLSQRIAIDIPQNFDAASPRCFVSVGKHPCFFADYLQNFFGDVGRSPAATIAFSRSRSFSGILIFSEKLSAAIRACSFGLLLSFLHRQIREAVTSAAFREQA